MGSSKIFKCGFDTTDYKDILPNYDEYKKNDFCLNMDDFTKGNVDKCVWNKYIPKPNETSSHEFQEREVRRLLKTGIYICISEEIVWVPPALYFQLNYTKVSGIDPEFRLKRVMNAYFRIRARNNKNCRGTLIVKNRQDGETTYSMCEALHLTFDMEDGQITINSKTREDAQNPCWKTMQSIYMGMPSWLFNIFFGDCTNNGKNIAETIKFLRFADEDKGITAKNIQLAYYPTVFNALDGKNSVRKAVGDEVLKWVGCNFGDWLNNASKFIMPGFRRAGMFDLFSSPPEKDSQSFRDGYEIWKDSADSTRDETGTTKSRIEIYHSNPLHGIEGAYDKFGDADPQMIYDRIMSERKRQPKSKLLEEIRGFPLTEEEIWGSMEGGTFWDNHKGLQNRQIYLLGTRFKDEKTKEPTVIRGKLEWKSGIVDNPLGVDFRQTDKDEFDVIEAPWAITAKPQNLPELVNIFQRPGYVETVIGADPFAKRYPGKSPSNGGAIAYKFLDLFGTGINKMPVAMYLNRPYHEDIYFENVLKACIYFQAPLQFENNHDRIGGYFTDRGYKDWVLPTIGEKRGSDKLGDAITARGKFMDEMIMLINSHINIPVDPNDPCLLDRIWFRELVDDLLAFNLKDTHANDAVMSFGQCLQGVQKLLLKKQRVKSAINSSLMDYLLG